VPNSNGCEKTDCGAADAPEQFDHLPICRVMGDSECFGIVVEFKVTHKEEPREEAGYSGREAYFGSKCKRNNEKVETAAEHKVSEEDGSVGVHWVRLIVFRSLRGLHQILHSPNMVWDVPGHRGRRAEGFLKAHEVVVREV
jgi:hypothetical protein